MLTILLTLNCNRLTLTPTLVTYPAPQKLRPYGAIQNLLIIIIIIITNPNAIP